MLRAAEFTSKNSKLEVANKADNHLSKAGFYRKWILSPNSLSIELTRVLRPNNDNNKALGSRLRDPFYKAKSLTVKNQAISYNEEN